MKKVSLTVKEEKRYRIIKNVVNGKTTKRRAEVELGVTRRTIDRLILCYKNDGKDGFIHGNAGRSPINKLSKETEHRIIQLYTNKYEGFNFNHFREFLNELEGINISESTLRNVFKTNLVLSPKAHKQTRRMFRAELKAKEKKRELLSKRDQHTLQVLEDVDKLKAHPSRSRMKYAGELVQMDASKETWFGNKKSTLHIAIDDQTGSAVGGHFALEETLRGYYEVLGQILRDYGAPAKILTDRRTVFTYNSKRKEDSPSTENPLTRFGYACKTLGTELAVTSVPQAKGRVERLIQTFQDRLHSELRLAQIKTIPEANEFLAEFINRYNEQFASQVKPSMSVFEKQLTAKEIDQILIIAEERTINSGHAIAYDNKRYLTLDGGEFKFLPRGTKVLVVKSFSGKMYATTDDDRVYSLYCLPRSQFHSPVFDNPQEAPVTKCRKVKVPAITHPWRRMNYRDYLNSLGISQAQTTQLVNNRYPQTQH